MPILSQLCANDIRFVNDIIYGFKFNYVLQLYVLVYILFTHVSMLRAISFENKRFPFPVR